MSTILVKGIILPEETSRLKLLQRPESPSMFDIAETYASVDRFLKATAQQVVQEGIKHLPLIQEGIISAALAASCYNLRNCLAVNSFEPNFYGSSHIIQVASQQSNQQGINNVLEVLKSQAGFRWINRWLDLETRTIEIPEQIEDVAHLISYIPQVLEA